MVAKANPTTLKPLALSHSQTTYTLTLAAKPRM
jgi:hypothetical protein